MIERGFQHRDISIGNVLCVDPRRQTKSVFETFLDDDVSSEFQKHLKTQLEQSGVQDHCCGFMIDGDLSVRLKSYFMKTHEGSRSV
jgi:hypothetical protein